MENAARFLVVTVVLAICLGIAIVLLNKDYRPANIAETNRGVFTNIPLDEPPEPAGESPSRP